MLFIESHLLKTIYQKSSIKNHLFSCFLHFLDRQFSMVIKFKDHNRIL